MNASLAASSPEGTNALLFFVAAVGDNIRSSQCPAQSRDARRRVKLVGQHRYGAVQTPQGFQECQPLDVCPAA